MAINHSSTARYNCRQYYLIAFIVILACTIGKLGTIHASAETSTVTTPVEYHFKGDVSAKTEPFTVEDGWEVYWKTESKFFQLAAFGVNDPLYKEGTMMEQEQIVRSFEVYQPRILANSSKPSGTASHPLGGTFYLRIKASGPWTIHVKAVKRTKDYLDVPYTGAP